jgi:hypothetical protein
MNEDAVRALVRDIVARHLAVAPGTPSGGSHLTTTRTVPLSWHASHARYGVLSGEEAEGPCFIEPAVRCNHCGYCQSHGH